MARKPHKYVVPSNYEQIKALRAKKVIELKECPFVKKTTKLRNYQTIGCLNTVMMLRTILGDDPGLGKTIQTLVAYAIMKQHDPTLKLLVVTTNSAMGQWGKEIVKFLTDDISFHVLCDKYRPKKLNKFVTGRESRDYQYEEHIETDILISGYYPVAKEYHKLIENRGENFMVAFDECQAFKNDKTGNFVGAYKIAEKAKRVYGLTATPIKNKLIEFYNIFQIIVPGLFPGVTAFKDEFTIQEMIMVPQKGSKKPRMVKQVKDYKNLERFKEIIDPYFIKRLADDVASDLPKITSRKILIEMGPDQKKVYAEAVAGILGERKVQQRFFEVRQEIARLEGLGEEVPEKLMNMFTNLEEKNEDILSGKFLKKNKAASLVFCQLAANGPAWAEEEGKSAKEDAFRELLEGELYGNKTIVFTRLKSGIPRLESILDKLGIKHTRVTGDENGPQRDKAMEDFQNPDSGVDVIFITQAGSAAINLQVSGVMVFYDTPWSFGDLVQTIGRARRIGSEHDFVVVYHLTCIGTIDEHVLDVLIAKKTLSDTVVGVQAAGALTFDGVEPVAKPEMLEGRGEIDLLFDEVFKK